MPGLTHNLKVGSEGMPFILDALVFIFTVPILFVVFMGDKRQD
jgi:hypothetical protein